MNKTIAVLFPLLIEEGLGVVVGKNTYEQSSTNRYLLSTTTPCPSSIRRGVKTPTETNHQ